MLFNKKGGKVNQKNVLPLIVLSIHSVPPVSFETTKVQQRRLCSFRVPFYNHFVGEKIIFFAIYYSSYSSRALAFKRGAAADLHNDRCKIRRRKCPAFFRTSYHHSERTPGHPGWNGSVRLPIESWRSIFIWKIVFKFTTKLLDSGREWTSSFFRSSVWNVNHSINNIYWLLFFCKLHK